MLKTDYHYTNVTRNVSSCKFFYTNENKFIYHEAIKQFFLKDFRHHQIYNVG